MRHYQRRWLRADVLAGVTVAAYSIPQVMAYAEVAGLPPVTGLWALIGTLAVYAVLGSSRQLSVGPESTTALMTAAAIGPLALADTQRYGPGPGRTPAPGTGVLPANRSTLRPAAAARSSRVHTTGDDQPAGVSRPGPTRREISIYGRGTWLPRNAPGAASAAAGHGRAWVRQGQEISQGAAMTAGIQTPAQPTQMGDQPGQARQAAQRATAHNSCLLYTSPSPRDG